MPQYQKTIKDISMQVNEIEFYSDSLFRLELVPISLNILPSYRAGQFVQILFPQIPGGAILRRPFSIYYVDGNRLGLLVQNVGNGTALLSNAKIGDQFNVLMPLGKGFSPPLGTNPLLVGGGVGIAPMYALARQLKDDGLESVTFLLGARDISLFPDLKPFELLGRVLLTTDNGSAGVQGFVTSHPIWNEFIYTDVYTCGPTSMMKEVARLAVLKNTHCEVSLENHMACGFGVCLCCVEQTKYDGYVPVCTQGPVFNANQLNW